LKALRRPAPRARPSKSAGAVSTSIEPSSPLITSSHRRPTRFHQRVLAGARREQPLAAMAELERHRALGAEVAAVLGNACRTSAPVRTRLSVIVSTMIAAPPMP
jgi:hypothetical protein